MLLSASACNGFAPYTVGLVNQISTSIAAVKDSAFSEPTQHDSIDVGASRRSILFSMCAGALSALSGYPAASLADPGDDESFASIAARAAKLSSDVGDRTPQVTIKSDDPRTAYDFTLPVAGETLQFRDIVHQQVDSDGRSKVKAILVVNMKEDDPIARKDIPELMSLASK